MNIEKLIQEYRDLEIEQSLNYIEFNKILITSHSTRIEGSTLTLNINFKPVRRCLAGGTK